MKVQYNPHDYRNAQEEIHLDNNNDEDDDDDSDLDVPLTQERHSSVRQRHGPQSSPPRSGSPTPRNSPKSHRGPSMHREDYGTVCGALTHSSTHSTLTRHQINQIVPNLQANLIPPRAPASPPYEPRWVSPVMKKSGDLGVRLVGGNAVGIFIHSVERDSAAHLVGLRSAEQILEYNGVNLRQATAEQAAYELAKPAEKVSLFVQYNPDKYNLVKDQPGDSYYVRAMFDRIVDINTDPSQLAFRKDDILFIDNTMYNGVPGNWSAWIVDVDDLVTRPVLIVGPLADAVLEKLISDYPHKFTRCDPRVTSWNSENIERALMTNNVIEYKRRGTQYECITVEAIKDVCERNQHCILNVHLEVVERLHQNHIYPIVLLIKFKSVKQIKEVKVPTMSADRISQKDAKNIFEHTQKLEGDYKHLISGGATEDDCDARANTVGRTLVMPPMVVRSWAKGALPTPGGGGAGGWGLRVYGVLRRLRLFRSDGVSKRPLLTEDTRSMKGNLYVGRLLTVVTSMILRGKLRGDRDRVTGMLMGGVGTATVTGCCCEGRGAVGKEGRTGMGSEMITLG
ncbi:hypothetical protein TCAL_04803 [Tigriopus californicus]|uniref:PDZ domain-containing protein n=1 Tax=Tigriopus californicus TaxID=6832 RepID=A0A553PRY2_TIGCA|nr:hypothetical protein TCAL_04803 [Tigriopus californicus]